VPSGIVMNIGKSRSGKPTVTIDTQIYSASSVDLSGLSIGDKVEFDSASSVYNGATVWFLNGYKVLQSAYKEGPSASVKPAGHPPVHDNGFGEYKGITDAERPFISNCVAHAIAAGVIEEPEQIEKWVSAAKNALRSQDE
jgi:hypothetical protein